MQDIYLKPDPNHAVYIQTLRNMSAENRLLKAIELTQLTKQLFLHGLKKRFPDDSQKEIKRKLLKHLKRCWNRNY